MRTLVFLFVLAVLGACETTVPVTQIMLRVQTVNEISERDDVTLRIETSIERDGKWTKRTHEDVEPSEIARWPVDVPLEAHDSVDEAEAVEIIVSALDGSGEKLAEVRAVTSFVRRQKKLLEVELWPCPEANVCPSADGCHGTACQTCLDRVCQDVRETRGSKLPEFVPGAAIEQSDASVAAEDAEIDLDAAKEEADTGDVVDMDAADAREPDVVDTKQTDGMGEALMGAEPSVVAEGGSHFEGGSEAKDVAVADVNVDADATQPCENGKRRCELNHAELCERGEWKELDACVHQTCVDAVCVGVCAPNERRCTGLFKATVESCQANGRWSVDATEEKDGSCEYGCDEGRCTRACAGEGSYRCSAQNAIQPLVCHNGMLSKENACPHYCRSGLGCVVAPSCGPTTACAPGRSCCEAPLVPGGTFKRSFDGTEDYADERFGATVSPFYLERYEVTVSRFRRWVLAYAQGGGRPAIGAGKTLEPDDQGWREGWTNNYLPADASALISRVTTCDMAHYSAVEGVNDTMPMNCVDWYTALAFCIWDGGRLPTEAEWNFAAAGGSEQRVYPWSRPGEVAVISPQFAAYDDASPRNVGSYADAGTGAWGHLDLVGNVEEWVRDAYARPYRSNTCDDCANVTENGLAVARGGGAQLPADMANASARSPQGRQYTSNQGGFRCVKYF